MARCEVDLPNVIALTSRVTEKSHIASFKCKKCTNLIDLFRFFNAMRQFGLLAKKQQIKHQTGLPCTLNLNDPSNKGWCRADRSRRMRMKVRCFCGGASNGINLYPYLL
jgi:hypothetical protein